MKTIWLALHNVKKIYKRHLFVFLLIVISMCVSSFGMLFYSGYIGQTCAEREEGNGDCLKLTLLDGGKGKNVIQTLDFMMMKYKQLSYIKINDSQNEEDDNAMKDSGMESTEETNEISISIVGEYNKQYEKTLLVGRNLLYEENEAVALIPSDYVTYLEYDDVPIDSKICFEKCNMNVVGVLSYMDEEAIIVPIKYYIENFEGKYLEIGFAERLSKSEREQIDREILEYGIGEESNWVLAKPVFQSWDFWYEFLQIVMIFLVIIINIFVIIYFLMLRMRQTYSIYSICGGGRIRTLFVIILQAFLIILIGNIIGSIVYLIFLPFAKSLKLAYQGSLVFYMIISALIGVISLIVTVITSIKVNRKITVYRTLE